MKFVACLLVVLKGNWRLPLTDEVFEKNNVTSNLHSLLILFIHRLATWRRAAHFLSSRAFKLPSTSPSSNPSTSTSPMTPTALLIHPWHCPRGDARTPAWWPCTVSPPKKRGTHQGEAMVKRDTQNYEWNSNSFPF